MSDMNFGTHGLGFQQVLVREILQDKKYGESIIHVIDPKYFDNSSIKLIVQHIKELYGEYERTPTFDEIKVRIVSNTKNEDTKRVHLDTLKAIKENTEPGNMYRDTALNFCKQQNFKKELKKVNAIIDNGSFEQYKDIEEIIVKALQVGHVGESAVSVFDKMEEALDKDVRTAIPTGIAGLDKLLKGGLGHGELGVILAPTGVGKTTLITKFANSAYNSGFNVLQIFFEDNLSTIKRKHYTIWTEITPDEQPEHKYDLINKLNDIREAKPNKLELLKLPSDGVTVGEIRSRLRKMISEGFKPDLILIDYVDCISADRGSANGEEWKSEGTIMRGIESMTSEFDIAIWVATQGNRESIASEVVTTNQMGGSIKKAQIGHVIISVGKTLEQKETKKATMTLLKSRIGSDGIIWQDCTFDNEFIVIDTDNESTLLGHEHDKAEKKANRAKQAFEIGLRKRQVEEQQNHEE